MEQKNKLTLIEKTVNIESKYRSRITRMLPDPLISFIYSNARKYIISKLVKTDFEPIKISESENIKLWDIVFNCSIFNAAGMFKNGEGYYTFAKMGAGAYLAGTTTFVPRKGNKKMGIKHPFMPYPDSNASSNWMGLPNAGHSTVANELSKIQKIKKCPVGISVAYDPDVSDESERNKGMLSGLQMYDKAGVDFIEINMSCPNVKHDIGNADCNNLDCKDIDKFSYLSDNFLKKRQRNLPVIVKYSNDFDTKLLTKTIDMLVDLGFDGVNFGNTSTDYKRYASLIFGHDKLLFEYFTSYFGGGLSGRLLKDRSLFINKNAANYLQTKKLSKEFYCIRTGGVSKFEDIIDSKESGIFLNEWFVGFFDNFAEHGFHTYKKLFD